MGRDLDQPPGRASRSATVRCLVPPVHHSVDVREEDHSVDVEEGDHSVGVPEKDHSIDVKEEDHSIDVMEEDARVDVDEVFTAHIHSHSLYDGRRLGR